MNERPNTADPSAPRPDPASGGGSDAARFPKPSRASRNVGPDSPPENPEVTPLDDDNNLEDGIEVEER